jgi:hypothetical protein
MAFAAIVATTEPEPDAATSPVKAVMPPVPALSAAQAQIMPFHLAISPLAQERSASVSLSSPIRATIPIHCAPLQNCTIL